MGNRNDHVNISEINFSEGAKNTLLRVERVAKAEKGKLNKSIPSVFLVGDKGVGSSKFAHAFERILVENHVYMVRGAGTFLELVFPKDASEKTYQRFFRSPKIVASLQNKFYGVFAISFEEWSGNELLENEWFKALLNYIDNNRDNIHFVFQVTNDFTAKEKLKLILGNHINLIETSLEYPSFEEAAVYIEEHLRSGDIALTPAAHKILMSFIEENIDMESEAFCGYKSLLQIAKSIQFEYISEADEEDEKSKITGEMLKLIVSRITVPKSVDCEKKRIGFSA